MKNLTFDDQTSNYFEDLYYITSDQRYINWIEGKYYLIFTHLECGLRPGRGGKSKQHAGDIDVVLV